MIDSWLQLAKAGYAHSVEVWSENQLAGGLYGMAKGQLFCDESMFSRATNASKTGLYVFSQHFAHFGGQLIDCQIFNPHTASLGEKEISREAYLQLLKRLKRQPVAEDCWSDRRIF